MTEVLVGPGGEATPPDETRVRDGLTTQARVRVIETPSGVLLLPLTQEPMSPELAAELEAWQAAGAGAWGMFLRAGAPGGPRRWPRAPLYGRPR